MSDTCITLRGKVDPKNKRGTNRSKDWFGVEGKLEGVELQQDSL